VAGQGRASERGATRREPGRRRDRTPTDDSDDDLTKRAAAEAVDDEVDRRVDDDQQVTDALVEEERTRTEFGVFAEQDEQQLRDECRGLTDDEHEDDNDQHARDVVLGTAARPRVRLSASRRPDTELTTKMTTTTRQQQQQQQQVTSRTAPGATKIHDE